MELGQMCFGNPTGKYDCPEYVQAFVAHLLTEVDRVWWNLHQQERDEYAALSWPGLDYRPYYWDDDEDDEAAKPNLACCGAAVRWYKHVGRGMTVDVDWDEKRWRRWLDESLAVVRAMDRE